MSSNAYSIIGAIVAVCIFVRLTVMVVKALRGNTTMKRALSTIGGNKKAEEEIQTSAEDEAFVREMTGLRAVDKVLYEKELICDDKDVSATIEVTDIPLNVELDDIISLFDLLIDEAIDYTVLATEDGGWISVGTSKTYANWTLMIMYGIDPAKMADIDPTKRFDEAQEIVEAYGGYIKNERQRSRGQIFVEISLTSVKKVPEEEETYE